MTKTILAGTLLALMGAAAAQAAPVAYTWTGMGVSVPGTSKCSTYRMTIDVTVDGSAVKGTFRQQGRDPRDFAATLDGKGVFKTSATLDGGNMDVTGVLSDSENSILLDGYCKFGGKLNRK
jgi:hypothetical protein